MKIALIFLSVVVAITHQQFQRPRERLWWSHYYYPSQPSINNYQRVHQDLQNDIQPDYRQFRPMRPVIYSKPDEFTPTLAPAEYQDYVDEDEYSDVDSRVNIFRQRRPLFPKRAQDQQRFLSSYLNFFLKTTTVSFTVTSSLTLSSIQSCIAAANFATSTPTACRRKRDLLDSNIPEDIQFAIVPTERQRVMPTALPSLNMNRELSRQMSDDQYLTSSKGLSPNAISGSLMRSLSEPRFLNSYKVVSTTVTTYSFVSTTVTQTVPIGAASAILCLPSGWIIC